MNDNPSTMLQRLSANRLSEFTPVIPLAEKKEYSIFIRGCLFLPLVGLAKKAPQATQAIQKETQNQRLPNASPAPHVVSLRRGDCGCKYSWVGQRLAPTMGTVCGCR